jgi:DNA-binding transcriptional regulator LsrR (DeoR family)
VLREDPHVRAALNQLETLDTVFVGLGSLSSNAILQDPHSPWYEARQELRSRGAVGDIALRFFDAHGSPVHTMLDDRILGITTHQLRRVGRVVAVAGGQEKVDAIAAALEAGIIKVLITDRLTAEALVARSPANHSDGNGTL